MKKLSIAAALLFAFGTFAFAQDGGKKAPAKKGTKAKTEKKVSATKKAPAKAKKTSAKKSAGAAQK